jgi:hypothetical protein
MPEDAPIADLIDCARSSGALLCGALWGREDAWDRAGDAVASLPFGDWTIIPTTGCRIMSGVADACSGVAGFPVLEKDLPVIESASICGGRREAGADVGLHLLRASSEAELFMR